MSNLFASPPKAPDQIIDLRGLRHSWRAKLRAATDGGGLLYLKIWEIAQGQAFSVRLNDGSISKPQIPNAQTRLAALTYLADKLDGTPVGEDKLLDAEQATSDSAHLRALSEPELDAKIKRLESLNKIKDLE